MNLNPYFKSVLDQDRASIVLCGLDHTILYMNPAAIRSYAKHGGAALVGRSLANCHNAHSNEMIQTVVDWFAASPEHNLIYTYHNEKQNKDVYMVALRDEDGDIYDIVAGKFFLCGLGDENFASLPKELQQKYEEKFRQPEAFLKMGSKIMAIPTEPAKAAGKGKTAPATER